MKLRNSADNEAAVQSDSSSQLGDVEDVDVLAKMGYKQELKRHFSTMEVFGVAFSIMGLLPSIASTLAYNMPSGPAGMVWGWFIPSMMIFMVGLAMADLGSSMPTSGGLYWWTHYFASPKFKNPLSFLVGYSNTIGLIGGLCSIDYGFALQLSSVAVIARDGDFAPSDGVIYCIFLGCVLSHGLLASIATRYMARLQNFFIVLNAILIIGTFIALPYGRRNERNDAKYIFTHLENGLGWPQGFTFIFAWLAPMWTIGGFDSAVHMSEEASNASKAVPYGILMSIGTCWIGGWIILIVIAACMSKDTAALLGSDFGQPMAQIYYDALGKKGAIAFMTIMFCTQWCMGVSLVCATSRQMWAFSRDGALPFSGYFRKISKSFGYVPLRCVWGCTLTACVLGLLCLINTTTALALFSLPVTGNNLAWLIPIFSRLVWGQDKFKPGPFYTGKLSIPIATVACVYLTFSTTLAMFPVGGPRPGPDEMNYAIVITGAVWLGSVLYYYVDAYKWFKGPKITLNVDEMDKEQEKVVAEGGLVSMERVISESHHHTDKVGVERADHARHSLERQHAAKHSREDVTEAKS